MRLLLLLLALLLGACPPTLGDDDDSSNGDDDDATAEPCTGVAPLESVCIEIAPAYSFTLDEAAAGIEIPYTVVVSDTVANVQPQAQDAGTCGQPDASGLILFERLSGGDETYCICDRGECAGIPVNVTLTPGEHAYTFAWTGRNWFGPSDTGNPLGDPFPAGEYTLRVSAVGAVDGAEFIVEATTTITLTP